MCYAYIGWDSTYFRHLFMVATIVTQRYRCNRCLVSRVFTIVIVLYFYFLFCRSARYRHIFYFMVQLWKFHSIWWTHGRKWMSASHRCSFQRAICRWCWLRCFCCPRPGPRRKRLRHRITTTCRDPPPPIPTFPWPSASSRPRPPDITSPLRGKLPRRSTRGARKSHAYSVIALVSTRDTAHDLCHIIWFELSWLEM